MKKKAEVLLLAVKEKKYYKLMYCDLNFLFSSSNFICGRPLLGDKRRENQLFQRLVSLNKGIWSKLATFPRKKNETLKVSAFMIDDHIFQKRKEGQRREERREGKRNIIV